MYSTVDETFISFTLTNVEFRKSRDFFAWILRGSSVGFAWNKRESSVNFAKFCDFFFGQAWKSSVKQLNRSVERNVKRIKASEKKIIFLLKPLHLDYS